MVVGCTIGVIMSAEGSPAGEPDSSTDGTSKEVSEPVHHQEEWLRRQYWDKERSVYEMADLADVSDRTISHWMDKLGVEKRGNHKRAHAVTGDNPDDARKYKSEEWLRTQYETERKSVIEMADMAGVTPTSICNWMDAAGVETRGPHQRDHVVNADVNEKLADKTWLQEKYVEQELSTPEIAERADCTAAAVWNWMGKHGLETRSPKEAIPRGEQHPSWDGGHTVEYGGEWQEQREKAIQRDSEKCRRCGVTREEERNTTGRDLHVHHIRKLKYFDDLSEGHSLDNLLTVCQDCHAAIEGLPIDNR